MPKLYHADVGFPEGWVKPSEMIEVRYSRHAKDRARENRVPILREVDLDKCQLVEATIENKETKAVVVRLSHDGWRDMCLAISMDGCVKTVWVNLKTDNHVSLNRAKYTKP